MRRSSTRLAFITSLASLAAAIALIVAILAGVARADIRIGADPGGVVSAYQARVAAARASGERVVVDGVCASACTLYLNLPASQICATPRAVFVFHSATDELLGLPDWRGNEQLMNAYPPHVRLAIGQRGGLWLTPIRIKGTALAPRCK